MLQSAHHPAIALEWFCIGDGAMLPRSSNHSRVGFNVTLLPQMPLQVSW